MGNANYYQIFKYFSENDSSTCKCIRNKKQVNAFIADYTDANGFAPTYEEISNAFQVPVDKIIAILDNSQNMLSLDQSYSMYDSEDVLGELVYDPNPEINPDVVLYESEKRKNVMKILDTLSPREKTIILERFGFNSGVNAGLTEIGEKLGLNHERVRQLESVALAKLRNPIRAQALKKAMAD